MPLHLDPELLEEIYERDTRIREEIFTRYTLSDEEKSIISGYCSEVIIDQVCCILANARENDIPKSRACELIEIIGHVIYLGMKNSKELYESRNPK